MEPFKEQVEKWVVEGNVDKSKRMSGDQMQERLEAMFPARFDIPSAHHIGSSINAIRKRLAKKAKDAAAGIERKSFNSCRTNMRRS